MGTAEGFASHPNHLQSRAHAAAATSATTATIEKRHLGIAGIGPPVGGTDLPSILGGN